MTPMPLPALLLALAACNPPTDDAFQTTSSNVTTPSNLATPLPPTPSGGREVKESDDLLDLTYSWPAEAAAIPALAARLEAELVRDRSEALDYAREDKAGRSADAPFNGHYLAKQWTVQGESARLLSLAAEVATFTGGAHGNMVYDQIIWDRSAGRAIEPADLFVDPEAAFAALSRIYCPRLDAQRAEKRGETLPLEGEGWSIDCPDLAKQRLVPAGKDGRFTTLLVLLPPYEAGAYAEGSYEVEIEVTDPVRALIKPEYRAEFGSLNPQPQ